jgi:hypothetical protein
MARKHTPHTIEAYGLRGTASAPWRKSFADAAALDAWTTAHDAMVLGYSFIGEACEHEWQEQPGEPAVDICSQCGEVRA